MRLGRLRTAVVALLATALVIGASALPSEAAQHQNANLYVNWRFPAAGGAGFGQNVDQEVMIVRKAGSSYWPMVWKWTDDPAHGGYLGLQTNGNRSDGSVGDTVDFSLWNSIAAVGPTAKSCAKNAEASGYNCASSYPIQAGRWYRLRVWKAQRTASGQWWAAYIQDQKTGVDTWVGSIEVASTHQGITAVQNFSEYFGVQVACNAVPKSIVDFTQPAADLVSPGAYRYYSSYLSSSRGACTGGGVQLLSEDGTNAARVTLGDKV